MSSIKFQIEITINEDDSVRVRTANPGDVGPWHIIGLLEKIKLGILSVTPHAEEVKE
jgi:hypothetical protein